MVLLRRGVLDTTCCDKVGQWFSPGNSVSSTNKTYNHDITEILLKVALITIMWTSNPKETVLKQDKIKHDSLLTRNDSCLITRKVLSTLKPLHNCCPFFSDLIANWSLSFT